MLRKFTILFFIFFASIQVVGQTTEQIDDLRTVVTLLDYVSKDYSVAVEDGKIIDDAEFLEQQDFVQKSASLHTELEPVLNNAKFNQLKPIIDSLSNAIDSLSAPELISDLALHIKNSILDLGILKISPIRWPSIQDGRVLYEQNCASCHGIKGGGDGLGGKGLEPEPTSFLSDDDMDVLSPFQAYNVIKLGVEGTGMASYDKILSENEIWDLAFYIMSMRYENPSKLTQLPKNIRLDSITKWTDNELKSFLEQSNSEVDISSIRSFQTSNPDPLVVSLEELQMSYELFQEGDLKAAGRHALRSYLEGVELVENVLPREMVQKIEFNMVNYRKAIKDGDKEQVEKYYTLLQQDIQSAQDQLSEIDYSFAFIYGAALSILLREALEALLIILIFLSILRPMKIKKAVIAVHSGWIIALALGVVSWIFVDKLVNLSGASREIMEGVGSLIAVAVLLYAGTWLHSHSEISKWTKYIKEKISKVSESGSWIGLSAFSFIVVFREVFEVILFLSSLNLNRDEDASSALFWALITTAIIIVIFTYIFLKTTKKLPLDKIFKFSAAIISVLAVILTGKGIRALQEAGYIGINHLDFMPQIDVLGIYPTIQTIGAQILILLIILLLARRNKKQKVKPVPEA